LSQVLTKVQKETKKILAEDSQSGLH